MGDLTAIATAVVMALLFSLAQRNRDAALWNDGVCAKNGIPWTPFDIDSSGAVGCRAGDEVIWVSASVMDVPYHGE